MGEVCGWSLDAADGELHMLPAMLPNARQQQRIAKRKWEAKIATGEVQ